MSIYIPYIPKKRMMMSSQRHVRKSKIKIICSDNYIAITLERVFKATDEMYLGDNYQYLN